MWSQETTRIKGVKKELEMNINTTVDFNSFLREVVAEEMLEEPTQIGGPRTIMEVNESLFSKRKYNQG